MEAWGRGAPVVGRWTGGLACRADEMQGEGVRGRDKACVLEYQLLPPLLGQVLRLQEENTRCWWG